MFKIATVTTAYNQFQDFENWKKHYNEYKDEILYHLIVDNNSIEEYKKLYKPYFTDSIILELEIGRGVTGGYNAAIKYIQNNLDVDYILFVMQDMNIPKYGVTKLTQCLDKNKQMGVIAPVNLYENKSNIIREHGGYINKIDFTVTKNFLNKKLDSSVPEMLQVDFLCGGNYMFKSEIFDKIGLFDEKIFMYGDEVDILLRVANEGYSIFSTTKTVCYHEHVYQKINGKKLRLPSDNALYYTGRNYFYLIKKYGSKKNFIYALGKAIYRFCRLTAACLIRSRNLSKPMSLLKGYFIGFFYYK